MIEWIRERMFGREDKKSMTMKKPETLPTIEQQMIEEEQRELRERLERIKVQTAIRSVRAKDIFGHR